MSKTPSEFSVDVAIAGDGLIGLSSAYHLLRKGYRVAVVGSLKPGRASTAAAGMLTPASEYQPWMTPRWLDLLKAGKDYYPEFLAGWTEPERVGYRATDFTLLDLHEFVEPIGPRIEWLPKLGFDCEWLEPAEVCAREPHLSPGAFRGGIRVHDEAVVDPIALWEALGDEVDALGIVRVNEGVAGFGDRGDDIEVETSAGGRIRAGRVVVAAGSWSAELAQLAGLELPVSPDKGQMMLLRGPEHVVNSVLYMPSGGCGSLLERAPGLYVLGSSEEWLRPVADNTVGVIGTLLYRLSTVLPAAAEWSIERMWAGFRPMTPDLLPIIGLAPDPRFVVATGHYRNGVMLAPITGKLVADLVAGLRTDAFLDMDAFRYGRSLTPFARFATQY